MKRSIRSRIVAEASSSCRSFYVSWTAFSVTDAAALREHSHPQEEIWNIAHGEIALVIDGKEHILSARIGRCHTAQRSPLSSPNRPL